MEKVVKMKKILSFSLFYLIFGLSFGVFYREFTRAMDFDGNTALAFVHPHILVLGFLFFIVLLILDKVFEISKARYYRGFLCIYNTGLLLSIITMIARGVLDVFGADFKALSYIAGAGHIILTAGLAFFMRALFISVKKDKYMSKS